MNKEEIVNIIECLAKTQGFYEKVLELLNEDEKFLTSLINQKFKSPIDLILYLEQ